MIYLGSDHGGFKLKNAICNHLKEKGVEFTDCGTYDETSVDYPNIAVDVCQQVMKNNGIGILVCGTGIGMSIAANKIKGVRAALAGNVMSAKMARMHNNANVLCLGQRVTGEGLALLMVDEFLAGNFEEGRHKRRVELISKIEGGC